MKKILIVGGCGFIVHNLALYLKKKGAETVIVDSLGVNNLLTFTDSEIVNKKLYNSILQDRLKLINLNNIKLIVQDRNYHKHQKYTMR